MSHGRGGGRRDHTVTPALPYPARRRSLAEARSTWGPIARYTRSVRSHGWIDRRSLALHEAVAAKIEARPDLLDVARANLRRWMASTTAPALREWAELLETGPLDALLAVLRSPSEEATRLRQSSPFAGLLTPRERLEILKAHDSRRS